MDPSPTAVVLQLGRALHRAGLPAHRLEDHLLRVAGGLGLEARFFTAPTALIVSFGPSHDLRTALERVEPSSLDVGRIAELDEVTDALVRGEIDPAACMARIDAIERAPVRYGGITTILCYALSAAAGARLFGGGLEEAVVAAFTSVAAGALAVEGERKPSIARIAVPAAGFVAAFASVVASRLVLPLSVEVATLAGLYVLLPGVSLTIAMTELATSHLISGTARLLASAMTFLQLVFGVALGGKLGTLVAPVGVPIPVPDPPAWTHALALLVGALSLVVLFRARRRDVPWIVLSGVAAYLGARLSQPALGSELAAFVGALALGITSNLTTRVRPIPAVVTLAPALVLLVPGSIGLRSLSSFLSRDVFSGVTGVFTTTFIAVGIVAGLLVANALVPPRRAT